MEFKSEKAMEDAFMKFLKQEKVKAERQVRCLVGIADVVSQGAVWELKLGLAACDAFHAAGQVVSYRNALQPTSRPIILTDRRVSKQAIQRAVLVGASVYIWNDPAHWPRAQSVLKAQDTIAAHPIWPTKVEERAPYAAHIKKAVVNVLEKQPGLRKQELDNMFNADGRMMVWSLCLAELRNEQKLVYWPDLDATENEEDIRCWLYKGPVRQKHPVWPPHGVVSQEVLHIWPQGTTMNWQAVFDKYPYSADEALQRMNPKGGYYAN